jgi:hypothetical protein
MQTGYAAIHHAVDSRDVDICKLVLSSRSHATRMLTAHETATVTDVDSTTVATASASAATVSEDVTTRPAIAEEAGVGALATSDTVTTVANTSAPGPMHPDASARMHPDETSPTRALAPIPVEAPSISPPAPLPVRSDDSVSAVSAVISTDSGAVISTGSDLVAPVPLLHTADILEAPLPEKEETRDAVQEEPLLAPADANEANNGTTVTLVSNETADPLVSIAEREKVQDNDHAPSKGAVCEDSASIMSDSTESWANVNEDETNE